MAELNNGPHRITKADTNFTGQMYKLIVASQGASCILIYQQDVDEAFARFPEDARRVLLSFQLDIVEARCRANGVAMPTIGIM